MSKKRTRRGGKRQQQKKAHRERMKQQEENKVQKHKSSLLNQVQQAYKSIDGIGQSKRAARSMNQTKVHSYSQQRHNKSNSKQFVVFLKKEYDIKNLNEVDHEHYRAFIEKKLYDDEVSAAHVQNIETSLSHLQIGMNKVQEYKGEEPTVFFTGRLVQDIDFIARDRSYTDDEYKAIHDELSPRFQDGLFLARHCGLRGKEIENIEVRHFVRLHDNYVISIPDGKGITKGGRYRELFIAREHTERVDRMLQGKEYGEKVCDIASQQTLRNAVVKAKVKIGMDTKDNRGLHGFRHSFARERMNTYLEKKDGAIELFQRMMQGLKEENNVSHYVAAEEEELKDFVIKQMDQVHSDIGHGKGRFDLAKVYLS